MTGHGQQFVPDTLLDHRTSMRVWGNSNRVSYHSWSLHTLVGCISKVYIFQHMLVSKSGQARGLQILTSESRTSLTTSDDIRVSPVIHYHRKMLWKASDCFSPRLKCRLRSKTRHVLDLHTNSVLLRIVNAHRRLSSKAAAASKRGRNKRCTGYDFGFTHSWTARAVNQEKEPSRTLNLSAAGTRLRPTTYRLILMRDSVWLSLSWPQVRNANQAFAQPQTLFSSSYPCWLSSISLCLHTLSLRSLFLPDFKVCDWTRKSSTQSVHHNPYFWFAVHFKAAAHVYTSDLKLECRAENPHAIASL